MARTSRRLFLVAGIAAIALGGCAWDQAARYYSDTRYPPKSAKQVEVLSRMPDRPCEVIADFQARNASVSYMRKQAAKIGADAIIVSKVGGYRGRDDMWAGEDSYSSTYSRITATAIRYR